MITEDYCSFEIAKLLKEKRFNEKCRAFYNDKTLKITYIDSPINNEKPFNLCLLAPTIQMAMKWLREVHKKVINVEYIDFLEHGEVWSYSVLDRNTFHEFTEKSESFTEHSYEEACEAAIKYCLTNLIK